MTPRQKDALDFIAGFIAAKGFSPSLDEIQTHLGLKSKSGSKRLVDALAADGRIRVGANRARSIAIIDGSAGLAAFTTDALWAELDRRGALQ